MGFNSAFKGLNITIDERPSSEANNPTASQVTVRILWNWNVHYRVHNSPPNVFIPCNINPVYLYTFQYYLCKIHINIILISTSGSFKRPLSYRFPHENSLSNSLLNTYVPHNCPSHAPLFDHGNNISRCTEITEILFTRFTLVTCYLLPLSPTYPALPPPILKHL